MPASTWRLPGVWIGFVGSVLVGVGGCSNDYSFNPLGWGVGPIAALAAAIDRPTGNLLVASGCILLSVGWLLLVPRAGRLAPPLLWLLWAAPLLIVPPVMSGDPFLYADLGWIMAHGGNPYLDVLGSYGGPFDPFVDRFWSGNGVAYPPLALEINRLMVQLAGMHPYWGVVAQRLPALVGVALVATFLPRLADRVGADRNWAVWLGVLNPIAVVHLIGGAHNDTLMAGVVVFALWLSIQTVPRISAGLVLAPVVIGLAMALKQQAGLAVIAAAGLPVAAQLVRLPWLQRVVALGWRTAVATVVALATFVAVSLASGLGFGWTQWLSQMGRARTMTLSVAIGDAFLWTGRDLTSLANTVIAALAVLGVAALLLLRPERPLLVTAWGSLLVLFIGQALHPWYVGLSLALLGLLPLRRAATRWVVFVTIGYLLAYSFTNLYNVPVLPSLAGGLVVGCLCYAVWTVSRRTVAAGEPVTRLG
ncbi:MAG: polyprenol phosphomannose-dependent alpha 1,6 mannosyltransferase MptB [Micropruina sp.]|uniref:polyprenol phosphomannose-dependent alpha 1,6 mannosyltransferase MptB n=1 Tax=Micropruina sp. TaxID=2737536 RepID=UPI0039E2AD83